MGRTVKSLQRVLDLLPFGCAWKASKGRCPAWSDAHAAADAYNILSFYFLYPFFHHIVAKTRGRAIHLRLGRFQTIKNIKKKKSAPCRTFVSVFWQSERFNKGSPVQLAREPQPKLKPVVATRPERKLTEEGRRRVIRRWSASSAFSDVGGGFKVGNIPLIRLNVDAAVLSLHSRMLITDVYECIRLQCREHLIPVGWMIYLSGWSSSRILPPLWSEHPCSCTKWSQVLLLSCCFSHLYISVPVPVLNANSAPSVSFSLSADYLMFMRIYISFPLLSLQDKPFKVALHVRYLLLC